MLSFVTYFMARERDYLYHQRIVSLGGGTGQFEFLNGLVDYNEPKNITGIAGTWDSGGSSGRLRVEKGVLPPGDARQILIALAEKGRQQRAVHALFNDRSHDGHSMGNLIIAFFRDWAHGDQNGLDSVRDLFLINSEVIYATSQALTLYGKTKREILMEGEAEIDSRYRREDYDPNDPIVSLYFDATPRADQRALRAIEQADKIIFPSGSLYGSILPHLLVEGVPEAILASDAKLIFVLNLMTEKGQTDMFQASDHLEPFLGYLEDASRLDYLVVNNDPIDPKVLTSYQEAGQSPVRLDTDRCLILAPKLQIIEKPVASYTRRRDLLRHDNRLARVILELE